MVHVLKSDKFSFKNKRFVAEDSDLCLINGKGEAVPFKPGPIPNSFPLKHGFQMESATTGKLAWFYYEKALRNRDGDIEVWIYKPMPEAVTRNPGLAGTEVHILND